MAAERGRLGTGDGAVQGETSAPEGPRITADDALGSGNRRDLSGLAAFAFAAACALLVAVGLSFAFDLPSLIGEAFHREQYLAIFLALALFACFVGYAPVRSRVPQARVPLYDWALALIGLGAAAYPAFGYAEMVMSVYLMPTHLVVLSTITIVLILEGARRVAGLPLAIVALVFIGYAFLSEMMPGDFYNRAVRPERLAIYLYLDSNAVLGMPLAIAMSIVLAFILFGSALGRTGATNFYVGIATALMGRFRGGAGKIAVMASALFGSISGSAVSNVVSTGVITIPMMRRGGFDRTRSGAIEAAASTGGQIMPPIMGATAFLMAELLNTSYTAIVVAALIPAILYFAGIFFYVHFTAVRMDLKGEPPDPERTAWRVLREGGVWLIPLIAIFIALFWLNWRPERAAFLGVAVTLAIHAVRTRSLGADWLGMIIETGRLALQITLITAVAGIIIGILNITGLGFALTVVLTGLGEGSLPILLLIVALLCIVLGMGMPTTGVYLILAFLVAPAIAELDVPVIAGHMFILFFGVLSFITPPVCFAAFAAATLTGAGPMRTGLEAARIVSGAYILPFMFVYNPELLMIGSPLMIAVTAAFALLAICLLSIAIVGAAGRVVSMAERALALLGAALLVVACSPQTLPEFAAAAAALAIAAILFVRVRAPAVATEPRGAAE